MDQANVFFTLSDHPEKLVFGTVAGVPPPLAFSPPTKASLAKPLRVLLVGRSSSQALSLRFKYIDASAARDLGVGHGDPQNLAARFSFISRPVMLFLVPPIPPFPMGYLIISGSGCLHFVCISCPPTHLLLGLLVSRSELPIMLMIYNYSLTRP